MKFDMWQTQLGSTWAKQACKIQKKLLQTVIQPRINKLDLDAI
jgi:hypothetical protein